MKLPEQIAHAGREPTRPEIDALTGPVLLEFGAVWCPYCQEIQAPLAALLRKHPEVQHLRIEDGRGKPLGRSFRVKLWPNLVFMRDGKLIQQLARPAAEELPAAFQLLEESK